MNDLPTTVATETPKAAGPKGMHRPQPIVFFCSKGHRIVVDAAMAGKKGRCKECKEIVTVPQAATSAAPPQPHSRPVASPPEVESDSRAVHREPTEGPSLIINEPSPPLRRSPNVSEKTVIGEPLIEGESAIVGPTIDPAEVQIKFGDETEAVDAAEHAPPIAEETPFADAEFAGSTVLVNPTARLMERLWYERRHGGVIEVHLAGAVSPILPSYFYPAWSDGSHGLFASLAADGTVTLTAVAWESVQKIVVRHVDSIPPDFLDIGLDE